MRLTTVTLGTGLGLAIGLLASTSAFALDTARLAPKEEAFSFEGPFGTYDRGALQRGYQVYKEVCSACHSAQHLAFHNLAEPGGPEFSEAQARALAAAAKVPAEPNDKGETTDDKGTTLCVRRPWPIISRRPIPTRMPPAPITAARCRPISA
jgi:ubiquinol-cytochrome c reductase cytochrome b/c1 subunit